MTNHNIGIEELFAYQKKLRQTDIKLEDNDKLFVLYKQSSGEEKIKMRNKIVENNLRLVIDFLIHKYSYSSEVNPVFDIEDVIQESTLILIESIDKYDPSKGKFSTFLYQKLSTNIYYINSIPGSPIQFHRSFVYRHKTVKKFIDLGYDDETISKKCNLSIINIKELRLLLSNAKSYEEMVELNQINDVIKVKDEQYGDYLMHRIIEQPNIEKRNQEILKSLKKLKLCDRLLLLRMFCFDGSKTVPTLNSLKNDFGFKSNVIYNRWNTIKRILRDNSILEELFNDVDPDYDDYDFDKTYYLQM